MLFSFSAVCLSFYLIFLRNLFEQGLELDDFVSGPRELLLKFVEENYPLPEKPEPLAGVQYVLCFMSSIFIKLVQ